MKLTSLTLHNFKGARDVSFSPDGQNITVYGDNETGKTTLADAFYWLLFGKDSQNRADFSIITIDRRTGEQLHKLDHSVEAGFDMGEGKSLKLKRTYSEKWTKPRGAAKAEQDGHKTHYHIDGVPTDKAREYTDVVNGICSEDRFRLLTDHSYFSETLSWQEMRKILLEVCGDVTDAQVIASDPELEPLYSIPADRSIDAHRLVLNESRRAINKDLDGIPARVDEATRAMPKEMAGGGDVEEAEAELNRLKAEKMRIEQSGGTAEVQTQIAQVEAKMRAIKSELAEAMSADYRAKMARKSELETSLRTATTAINHAEDTIRMREGQISDLDVRIETCRTEYGGIKNRAFIYGASAVCESCARPLPLDQVESLMKEAEGNFNERKANDLAENVKRGQSLKEERENIASQIETIRAELVAHVQDAERIGKELSEFGGLQPPTYQDIDVSGHAEYQDLHSQRERLSTSLQDGGEAKRIALDELAPKLALAEEAYQNAKTFEDNLRLAEQQQKRIEELEATEKNLTAELEKIDQMLFLIDKFTRAKVATLTERINAKFKIARFKLFHQQENGGIRDTCEVVVDGVPFRSVNTAGRINAGLDIINTLAEHYGFAPPVFIDHAESVTDIIPTLGQQIRLVVSESDKSLRFEATTKESIQTL